MLVGSIDHDERHNLNLQVASVYVHVDYPPSADFRMTSTDLASPRWPAVLANPSSLIGNLVCDRPPAKSRHSSALQCS